MTDIHIEKKTPFFAQNSSSSIVRKFDLIILGPAMLQEGYVT